MRNIRRNRGAPLPSWQYRLQLEPGLRQCWWPMTQIPVPVMFFMILLCLAMLGSVRAAPLPSLLCGIQFFHAVSTLGISR